MGVEFIHGRNKGKAGSGGRGRLVKLYAVIWEDRRADITDVFLFTEQAQAERWAAEKAMQYSGSRGVDRLKLSPEMVEYGWCLEVVYNCEGDSLRVMAVEVDRQLAEG